MAQEIRRFLKDESAAAAIEYILLTCGIAVAIITAVKPADHLPGCPTCGRLMRRVTAIAKFGRHPELRAHECGHCKKTLLEEWIRQEGVGGNARLWGKWARTCADGLMVHRKRWAFSNLEIVLVFGTWVGSIVFGWKQQPYWLAIPAVAFVGYSIFLLERDSAWASRRLAVGRQKIFEMGKSWGTASLAVGTLRRTSHWLSVLRQPPQQNQKRILRRDLALETICPGSPFCFSPDQAKIDMQFYGS
jgi:Flp pilus assembly pilin Flp